VVQIAADKSELDRLEALILQLLAESSGDILADDNLIVTLDQSGSTTEAVSERMKGAEKTMAEIEDARREFMPVAVRASILYFVVADMGNIDPMYQWSLEYFSQLFRMRMGASTKSEDPKERVKIIIDDMTLNTYIDICRGLFEDHKLCFSLLIACNVLKSSNAISKAEWLFFLRGLEAAKAALPGDFAWPEGPKWLPENTWRGIVTLEEMTLREKNQAFMGLQQFILSDERQWQSYYDNETMYELKMPSGLASSLTPFQQLLVIRTLRENFTTFGCRAAVAAALGEDFVASPPADLVGAFNSSINTTPLIFILSAGADPTANLLKLAKDRGYEDRLHILSLGQGQGPKAEKLVTLARENGDWVCLQNCHLAASWMNALERLQETQNPEQIDPDYRLWLTSMPTPVFPVPVLQSGVKMTNEPPKGLKFNLGSTFTAILPEQYEACSKPKPFKKLLFALAFFHAVILERRKFGPIGWNIPYEWMESDLIVSMEQLRMYLESQAHIPYQTFVYLVAEVNYGGRVTDDKDVRLISAILERYFTPDILDDNYKLSSLDTYYAPTVGPLEDTRQFIRELPTDENPRVFGLHPNALITAQTNQARRFHGTIVSVQPRISGGGGGKTVEEIVNDMVIDYMDRLPKLRRTKEAHEKTYEQTPEGGIVSIGVFHSQEYERFEILLKGVLSSLKTLDKAIKGLVVMSAELEDMFNGFNAQKVPGLWVKRAYPCLKPLNSWFADFILRIEDINTWLVNGPPLSFWVPCYFFPQGFMTACLQVYARHTQIAIDTLGFSTDCTSMADVSLVVEAPETGVYIHGLFLQGCGFDFSKAKLAESQPRQLFKACPVVHLRPMEKGLLEEEKKANNDYPCPLYKTSERRGTLSTTGHSTNFVLYFNMPNAMDDANHWVRRGVCLLCMLDD
jgi:dynein heavy chain